MVSFYPVDFGTPEFDLCIDLRHKVLREPLSLEFSCQDISIEFNSYHLACFHEDNMVGVLVLHPLEEGLVKMRQVAIDDRFQSKGLGSKLVVYSEVFSKRIGYLNIVLHARDTAVNFYKKLGYTVTETPFIEVGIPHFKMTKRL